MNEPAKEELRTEHAPDPEVSKLIALVDDLLRSAVEGNATSVHVEQQDGGARVRFRSAGALRVWRELSALEGRQVAARLRILANLDISENRLPIDGVVKVRNPPARFTLVTLPTTAGVNVILRRVEETSAPRDLADCGYEPELLERLERAAIGRRGLVLIAGSAASGRHTTRYAMLARAATAGRVVMTVETELRRRVPGVNQLQAETDLGLTVNAALLTIARCDPDVVMADDLGEVESARTCVRIALEGRLVIGTVNVGEAREVPARLADLGVDPYLLSSALRLVVAQRLVRRLCERCREPERIPAELAARYGLSIRSAYRAVGCADCQRTGHASTPRLLAEGYEVDEDLRSAIARREILRPAGRSLREQAFAAVTDGTISLAEALEAAW